MTKTMATDTVAVRTDHPEIELFGYGYDPFDHVMHEEAAHEA